MIVAHLLEQDLSRRLAKPIVVRNAGVVGWDPNHYFQRARQLLSRDTFALVVVGIFVGNDAVIQRLDSVPPRRPAERKRFRLPHGVSRGELVNALLAPANDQLEEHSHLFILLKNQLSVWRMRLGLTAQYMPPQYLRTEAGAPRWRITAELSRDLAAVAASRGTPTLFVLIPESFQVYENVFKEYVRGFGIDSSTLDLDQPTRRLSEEFGTVGLTFVDALPPFRAAAAQGSRLFGGVDTHFSPAAHALLAKIVAPHAERLLAVPEKPRSSRETGARSDGSESPLVKRHTTFQLRL